MASYPQLPWETRLNPVHVLVIGDLILDEYLEGQVTRISPEAPVPVHLVTKSSFTAGGAANVARNIQLAGGKASICGVCGEDEAATHLKGILQKDKVGCDLIMTDPTRPTVRKTRVASQNQQLVRIDWEKTFPLAEQFAEKFIKCLEATAFDVMVLSDYAKGGLTTNFISALIKTAKSKGAPIIIDPKGNNYGRYTGCDLVTPNRKEACEALGFDPAETHTPGELAVRLQERYNLNGILLTLGAGGMYFLPAPSAKEKPVHLAAEAREVFDVSGAGDTVVAMMALALGAKCPAAEAMHLANLAAGKVVEKWGTQPILRKELLDLLNGSRETAPTSEAKIIGRDELVAALGKLKKQKRKIVFTNGCFDILHAGHVTYLEKAKALGDALVIGVNSDASVKRLKGPKRPVNSTENRTRLLAALGCVDYVCVFEEDTPLELISSLLPDVLVKGADYELNAIVGADTVMKNGGTVKQIPLVEGLSTSALIDKIRLSERHP